MNTDTRWLAPALIIMAALIAYMFVVPFPHAYGQEHAGVKRALKYIQGGK